MSHSGNDSSIDIRNYIVIIAIPLLLGMLIGFLGGSLRTPQPEAEGIPSPTANPTPHFMLTEDPQRCGPFEYRKPWVSYPVLAQGRCVLVAEDGDALGIAWSGFPVMIDPYTKSRDQGGEFSSFTPELDGEQWYCEKYEAGSFCVEAPEGENLALRITVAQTNDGE